MSGYKRTVGSISGWNQITTNDNDTNNVPVSDHDYTVADLELMLRGLKKMFDPKKLDRIESLIYKHIEDKNNPHKTDLSKLHIDPLQELYKLWLEQGYVGSRDQFIKVIFQYVKIADLETALKGESYDEVTSVKDVSEMLKQHDEDDDAHSEMLGKMFPGSEVKFDPTFSIKAYVGLPYRGWMCDRSSKMWVINSSGFLEEVGINQIGIDYSLGRASIPLFGEVSNLIEESENFRDSYYYSVFNGKMDRLDVYSNIREDDPYVDVFLEEKTIGPTVHGLMYNGNSVVSKTGEYYTISVFIRPYGRDNVGIQVSSDVLGSIYGFVQFNLKDEKVFYHDDIENLKGELYSLHNGWYRLCMTFRASEDGIVIRPSIYSLDIYDGDQTHEGIDGIGFAIFGLMITETSKIVPYIPSLGEIGKIDRTGLLINISDTEWYNGVQGTWVFDFDSHHDSILDSNKTLFTIARGASQSTLIGKYPPGYRNRFYYTSFDKDNKFLTGVWCHPDNRDRTISCYSYGRDFHLAATYGEPEEVIASRDINDQVGYIYLGSNRLLTENYDGYLYGFDYYPYKCTKDNIRFFRGEE